MHHAHKVIDLACCGTACKSSAHAAPTDMFPSDALTLQPILVSKPPTHGALTTVASTISNVEAPRMSRLTKALLHEFGHLKTTPRECYAHSAHG